MKQLMMVILMIILLTMFPLITIPVLLIYFSFKLGKAVIKIIPFIIIIGLIQSHYHSFIVALFFGLIALIVFSIIMAIKGFKQRKQGEPVENQG